MSLKTTLAGIQLDTCIYNASGPRSGTAAALNKIARSSGTGAVLSKSATLESQKGNPMPRVHHSPDGLASFNSEGLPNNGIDYYIDSTTIDEVMEGSSCPEKPYFVSLSGKTLQDNLEMIRRVAKKNESRISAIELNLACPNVIGKPIIAYDMDQMEDILQQINAVYRQHKNLPPLGIKLPPYLDFQHFQATCKIINKHRDLVRYVASINTIGNALAIDTVAEQPFICSNNGFAGLSGPAVHYTALANVRKLRELLDDSIDVVGVGGVSSGLDAFAMLLAGACAVQIGTCHWKEGPQCFDRVAQELKDILVNKGYGSVADVSGKLQSWSKEGAAKSRAMTKTSGSTVSERSVSSESSSITEAQLFKMISVLLVIVIAVLLTDRFHMRLLPFE